MILKTIGLIAVFLLLANPVAASDTVRGKGTIGYSEDETNDNDKYRSIDANFLYYLNPVQRKQHPWREAAFLERAANVAVRFGRSTRDYSNSETKYEGPHYAISGTYASPSNPLLATIGYRGVSREDKGTNLGTSDIDSFEIELGGYLTNTFALTGIYRQHKSSFTANQSTGSNRSNKITRYGVRAKLVHALKQQQAISMNLSVETNDYSGDDWDPGQSANQYVINVTYYPIPQVGIAAHWL
ncbi:putative porin, partial [Kaarinaea lacus]